MNIISGLLLKDLYVFKSYKKNIIFSIIVFAIMIGILSLNTNALLTGTIMFLFVFGMNSISTFSYDEMAEAEKYLLSLPISKKDIVRSKYLFAFINSFCSLVIGFLISIIVTYIATGKIPLTKSFFDYTIYFFTSITFLMCVDIPCIYKWGVEKGRMQAVIAPIFIILFLGIVFFIIYSIFPAFFIQNNLDILYQMLPIFCIILNIIMYFSSYFISYKIFLKKDL